MRSLRKASGACRGTPESGSTGRETKHFQFLSSVRCTGAVSEGLGNCSRELSTLFVCLSLRQVNQDGYISGRIAKRRKLVLCATEIMKTVLTVYSVITFVLCIYFDLTVFVLCASGSC